MGVGADTALTTGMSVLSAAANYAFRLVVLGAFTTKEDAGIYVLTIAYLSITSSLADFGLNATIFPKLAMARGPNTLVFRAAFVMRMWAIALTWIGLNAYLLAVGKGEILVYVNIGFAGVFISGRLTGVRQSLEQLWRLKGRAWISAAFTVLDSILALAVVLILDRADAVSVFSVSIVWTLSSIPGFVLLLWPLLPSIRSAERLRERVPMRYYRRLFWASLPVGLMAYAGQFSGQLETFVLDLAGTLSDVGAYGVAVSPLMGLVFVPVAISVGLAPLITQIHRGARNDIPMPQVMSLGVRLVLVVALGVAVVTNVFAGQIMMLFPPEYANDVYILRTYTAISALVFVSVANDQYLIAAGYRRQVAIGAMVSLGLAIALEVPLVFLYGVGGMMAAKILALLVAITYQLAVFSREMRAGALQGMTRMIGPIAVFAAGLVLTWNASVALQAAIMLPAVAGALVLFGALRRDELAQLRGLRLS